MKHSSVIRSALQK